MPDKYKVAIYVRDTREILETIDVSLQDLDRIDSVSVNVNDNHKPLKGANAELFQFKVAKSWLMPLLCQFDE
jgi:hypothetical protein